MACNKQKSQFREAVLELKAAIKIQSYISTVATTLDAKISDEEILQYLSAIRLQKKAEAKIYELFPG
ncbi:MAG: hypothetical protein ABI688_00260 [Bacteroidota bacterium]